MSFNGVSLYTSTGLDLNDGIRFVLLDIDLGSAQRDEAWIESWYSDTPVLSNFANRKSKVTLALKVNGILTPGGSRSVANLNTNVRLARDAFTAQSNVLYFGANTDILYAMPTFPSPIDPIPYDMHGSYIRNTFTIPRWTFSVWRHPNYNDNTQVVI